MKRCMVCGGDCDKVGVNTYVCKFCGREYSDEDFITKTTVRKHCINTKLDAGADLFSKVVNGVLEIKCRGKNKSWCGSGYIISDNGYAVTNAHVAADEDGKPCERISVNVCGQSIQASVVALADDKAGGGSGIDLALIKLSSIPQGATVLKLADFNMVNTGERVFVLGNSLGDGTCITSGIVSDKNRVLNGKTLLMTDCAINGGNSGGPIFNVDAEVIGTICSARIKSDGSDTKGMNYAVPVNLVEEFISGRHRVSLTKGGFEMPPTYYCVCPKCGGTGIVGSAGNCLCRNCGHRWLKSANRQKVQAKAPCPRCHSWNTNVENGIFYCEDCGFEG